MKIALDYDLTFTLDPVMWEEFIILAERSGHEVRIVTARSPVHDNINNQIDGLVDIIYCDGVAKRFHCEWFAENGDGWMPDIWIDDKPQSVDNNSTATREVLAKWREERDKTQEAA